MNHKIKIETKCWERDWEILLKTNRIQKMVEYNCYPFSNISLLINNVKNIDKVKLYADKLIEKSIISEYIVVDDYAKETLDFFNLSKKQLGIGYFYSIAELVGIYLSKEDFILHFSSDTFLKEKVDWIDKAIPYLDKKNKVANLSWNNKFDEAKNESISENDDFYYSYGFSDQMYLIRTEDFKKQIYNQKHVDSDRYPKYGGELFEKRIDSWLRNNQYCRLTYKHSSYFHKNFPSSKIAINIKLLTGTFHVK
tara:strand:- start:306 stop:1061 length:756 start_codon:yes stop_codon:yes gene_type:complete